MTRIHRFALVPHPAGRMFELVLDVVRYPEFLDWVERAELHEQDDFRQVASLDVRVAGIAQRFTTENRLDDGRSLVMELCDGPFSHLSGQWRFDALGEAGSRVSLELAFALSRPVLMLPFQFGFGRLADRMVDDFSRRAEQLYG